jgi:hypothetical protein
VALSALDPEIQQARLAYRELRGYLRGDEELGAIDGVFNAIKSPQRLRVDEPEASVDLKLESLENMVASLHRVLDLLSTLGRLCFKRTSALGLSVQPDMNALKCSPSFMYFDHFTNATKHTGYVMRGMVDGVLFFESFSYKDRGQRISEPRKNLCELIEDSREVIALASRVMSSMSRALDGVVAYDPHYAVVSATPITDPSLHSVRSDRGQ